MKNRYKSLFFVVIIKGLSLNDPQMGLSKKPHTCLTVIIVYPFIELLINRI